MDGCKNNPENSSTTKVGEHIPSVFQYIQYHHLKTEFCEFLREHADKIINFRKEKVKLDLLTDTNILLLVKNGIRGGRCHSIYLYSKANNIYMKDYDKNKESSCLQY